MRQLHTISSIGILLLLLVNLTFASELGSDPLDCDSEIIFQEDFGSGSTNPGPPLAGGTITYCYENLAGTCPSNSGITPGSLDDGSYSIMNNPRSGIIYANGDTTAWLSMEDHTVGDSDGYMLVVNASFETGEFYRLNDIPVIGGEDYAFSAWFANILSDVSLNACGNNEVPLNVNFNVEDAETGSLLGSFSSGDIFGSGQPLWEQTEFQFTATSSFINIVLENNGPGGCGNDFAIDDIQLMGCIANTTTAIDDTISACIQEGITANILDNDQDEQGDIQTVSMIIVDTDGDLIPDTEVDAGQAVLIAGLSEELGGYPDMGTISVSANGNLNYVHSSQNLPGMLAIEYIICDDGIPSVCDTAGILLIITCEPNSTLAIDDELTGCEISGITGNVLSNDMDAEGHQLSVSVLLVDLDGDGIPETTANVGQSILTGGVSNEFGPVSAMGELTLQANGTITLVHEPINLAGTVNCNYIVCDNGIPTACDTASVVININCQPEDTLGCRTEVVFTETFGSGMMNPGPQLPLGTITYCYEDLSGSCPSNPGITPGSIDDGSYSIMNDPSTGLIYATGDTTAWASIDDHTPSDTGGYMLVVNASFAPGEFYRLNDIPLVAGEEYAFSAWFANILTPNSIGLCGDQQAPVNVNFIVEDAATGNILGSLSTGDIFSTGIPVWERTEFLFTASSPSVNIVLVNNAPGGCGNDFAIDDIELIGCIANTTTAVDDVLSGCIADAITGNILDNDMDEQGDAQVITNLIIDTDGDLIPETEITTGIPVQAGGFSAINGQVDNMGTLTINSGGGLLFEHNPDDPNGSVVFDYIICDDGIPFKCDTGRVTLLVDCPPPDTLDCVQEVIFMEDFGSGAVNPGSALPAGTITYCYEDLTGSCPSNSGITPGSIDDGSYSIMNNPQTGQISATGDTLAWLSLDDHTDGDVDGYMLVVNADFEPGEFYRRNNVNVVEGEEYLFSAWFANIQSDFSITACEGMHVPVNVNFNVEDANTDSLLGSFSTGDLFATGMAEWTQTIFGFIAASNSINIVLVNNGPGGCGNDFVIDDIELFGCVANTIEAIDDVFSGCEEELISGNVLENDLDPQNDNLAVISILADINGDLMPDGVYEAGQPIAVGGMTETGIEVPRIGILTVYEDGTMTYEHEPYNFPGDVVFEYVVCDNGLPVACDTAQVRIIVDCIPPCFIPDFISPNGDGLNDVFEIECAPDFPDMAVTIYNRWGNMVWFSENGYQNNWDGTWLKNNQPLPDATYYYIVKFNAFLIPDRAGDILLMR